MWTPHIALGQVPVRVAVVYLALLLMVRVTGKREIGQLGPLDLLAMLLLSETVSPALTAQDTSLPAALVAAGTLLAMTFAVSRLTYRFPAIERFVGGSPAILVRHGRVDASVAAAEGITDQELEGALRESGVESLAAVKRAVVEPSGKISVVKEDGCT